MSFHLLSIDVGIRNLGFCMFSRSSADSPFVIAKWDVTDLCLEESRKCDTPGCKQVAKFGKACEAVPPLEKCEVCYCAKHAKQQKRWLVPKPEHKPTSLAKRKVAELQALMEEFGLVVDAPVPQDAPTKTTRKKTPPKPNKPTKAQMVNTITAHLRDHYLDFADTTNATTIPMVEVGSHLKSQFDLIFRDVTRLDAIVIENQIGPLANRMKTLQGMIAQYFIMTDIEVGLIEGVSSVHKLKAYEKERKGTYKNRKQLGVTICLERMGEFNADVVRFQGHKKKDDLADCFLQGVWYLESRNLHVAPLNK